MPPRPAASHLEKLPPLLRGAVVLLGQGLWEPAVHALYYACLHTALALLSTIGTTATTHRGISQLFGLHFAKDGPLPGHFGRMLAQLMTDRELADYGVGREITPDVATEAARRAAAGGSSAGVWIRRPVATSFCVRASWACWRSMAAPLTPSHSGRPVPKTSPRSPVCPGFPYNRQPARRAR